MPRNTLLTAGEREYIEDPDGFTADHEPGHVTKIRFDIRRKYQCANDELELLEATAPSWDIVEEESDMGFSVLTCVECGEQWDATYRRLRTTGETLPPRWEKVEQKTPNHADVVCSDCREDDPEPDYEPVDVNEYGNEYLPRHALLTDTEREYLDDPDGYAASRSSSAVRKRKYDLRRKYQNAVDEIELLDSTFEAWDVVEETDESVSLDCVHCHDTIHNGGSGGHWPVDRVYAPERRWQATGAHYVEDWCVLRNDGRVVTGVCPDCIEEVDELIKSDRIPCQIHNTHRPGSDQYECCWRHIPFDSEEIEAIKQGGVDWLTNRETDPDAVRGYKKPSHHSRRDLS